MRKKIALRAVEGLHYLHEMCNPKIFHQDLKPDNILLGDELEAVVADFGLIKPLTHEESHPSTSSVRGTPGYIALEYFSSSRAIEKGDVYAFGIVLLELICAKTCFREKIFVELLDLNLKPTYDQQELEEIADLALSCIENLPIGRSKMVDIVDVLSEMIH
ncbi:hypothetical protein FH972_026337 [Carpinus fangiana]|uniref:Protein kinase domain-containing protein n=1 Tax=Carpinus fangiana TaxID=176857 RepID=A0A5N6L471_9ROSI|nr:hypothetical protein FH972_026337 [Carpinus fangiana]